MNINLDNLFDYCLENIETQNKSIYYIGNKIGNSLFTISIDLESEKIYSHSNEWLSLIKSYYPSQGGYYNTLISEYKYLIKNKNINYDYANYNIIPFVTSFSNGTAHGYSGLCCILNEYLNNYNLYRDYKILVYSDSQK